ncbi:hypothetical protein Lal_00025997 [Lupinus albus]|nr:hypothetical protein Lal_00025997 [Lupinus albus]
MLERDEKFQKAFDRLYDQESDFRKWFGDDDKGKRKCGPPTEKDWNHARIFIQFLEIFYRMTLRFSSSLHINPLLFVGNVLDPRFKLEYVTWSIEDTCTGDLAANILSLVKDTLEDLYKVYAQGISENMEMVYGGDSSNKTLNAALEENLKGSKVQDVVQNKKKAWKKQKRAKTNFEKTDLERYLTEDIMEDEYNFDILACTTGRVLDVFRNSLSPKMVKALIFTQNWINHVGLKFYDKDFDQFDSTEKIIGG